MKKTNFYLTNKNQLPELMDILTRAVLTGEHVIEINKRVKRRSGQQNRSLHLYCEIIAEMMRNAGIDQRELVGQFKQGFTVPVQAHMIKDLFRAIGKVLYKKDSTSDLTTVEIQDVHKILDQRLAEAKGISCAWPSDEPPCYGGEYEL